MFDPSLPGALVYSVVLLFSILTNTALWLVVTGVAFARVRDPRPRLWLAGSGLLGALFSLTTPFLQMAVMAWGPQAVGVDGILLVNAAWMALYTLLHAIPWLLLVAGLWLLARPLLPAEPRK